MNLANGGKLVTSVGELPNLSSCDDFTIDFETTSGDDKRSAWHPYLGDRVAGIAITPHKSGKAWYLPLAHRDTVFNLPRGPVDKFMKDLFVRMRTWRNHNVKFDAHFAHVEGWDFHDDCELRCSVVAAKLLDSDRSFKGRGYDLTDQVDEYLGIDISPFEKELKRYLQRAQSKDYGVVPVDMMAPYACQDTLTADSLSSKQEELMPEDGMDVWRTERLLTPVLFDIERDGMRIDPSQLKKQSFVTLYQINTGLARLEELAGFTMRPWTPGDCYEFLCNIHGLPVLGFTDKNNPSFDKDALLAYANHPSVVRSPELKEAVGLIRGINKLNTFLNLFLTPYTELHAEGFLHPSYDQIKRTGRMGCKDPNMQQLGKLAKALIHPDDEDSAFLSLDYSQIEFRWIVHYIRAVSCIEAYRDNPDTDFHTWVAEMCGISRSPAKNINFAMGFGAGKAKVLGMLAGNEDLVKSIVEEVDGRVASGEIPKEQRQEIFTSRCNSRAEAVYNEYHNVLAGLKGTARRACAACESRGYVFNAYKRRRHLGKQAAWKALNALVQGTAADVMKERTVALAPRYNQRIRESGLTIRGMVHDELLWHGSKEATRDPALIQYIAETMEDISVECRVPMRVAAGWSDQNWRDASGDDGKIDIERSRPSNIPV